MLQKWRVPVFFTALPVLLRVALLLFFVGLAEFLVALNIGPVAIPVVAAIALSITFLITTTALPGLYLLFVAFKPSLTDKTIPVPNPYKSPQAELFRSALSFVCLHIVQPSSSLTTSLLTRIPWCHNPDDGWYQSRREWYKDILPFQSWRELDLKWMFIRRESSFHLAHRTPGAYEPSRYNRLKDNWWPRLNPDLPFTISSRPSYRYTTSTRATRGSSTPCSTAFWSPCLLRWGAATHGRTSTQSRECSMRTPRSGISTLKTLVS